MPDAVSANSEHPYLDAFLDKVRDDLSRGIDPPKAFLSNVLTDLHYERQQQKDEIKRLRAEVARHEACWATFDEAEAQMRAEMEAEGK